MLAAIALGSNLPSRYGEPSANLHEAIRRLRDLGEITAVSSFYETDPVGYTHQPKFTNAAALLQTELSPLDLLHHLLSLESSMGRVRAADIPPKGPRVIDLDLLLYQDEHGHGKVMLHPDLTLPHPALPDRAFVLEPLAEIAPDLVHPLLELTISELRTRLRQLESSFRLQKTASKDCYLDRSEA